ASMACLPNCRAPGPATAFCGCGCARGPRKARSCRRWTGASVRRWTFWTGCAPVPTCWTSTCACAASPAWRAHRPVATHPLPARPAARRARTNSPCAWRRKADRTAAHATSPARAYVCACDDPRASDVPIPGRLHGRPAHRKPHRPADQGGAPTGDDMKTIPPVLILALAGLATTVTAQASARDGQAPHPDYANLPEIIESDTFRNGHPDIRWRQDGMQALERNDPRRAFDYFQRAARHADKPSQAMVAEMLWTGRGVIRDRPLAYAWMDLAAERQQRDLLIKREYYW